MRLDERAADVVVADQAHLERQPGLLGVADGGRHAGVGHRDHDVGAARRSRARAGGRAPCAPRRRCGRRPGCRDARSRRTRRRSGARARAANGRSDVDARRSSMTTISPGSISRSYCASTRSSAQVSDATTTGVLDPAEHQRPEAARVARGDQLRLGEEHERVGAAHLRQRVDDAVDQRRSPATRRSGG